MIEAERIGASQHNAAFFLNGAGCFKPKADGTLWRQNPHGTGNKKYPDQIKDHFFISLTNTAF